MTGLKATRSAVPRDLQSGPAEDKSEVGRWLAAVRRRDPLLAALPQHPSHLQRRQKLGQPLSQLARGGFDPGPASLARLWNV